MEAQLNIYRKSFFYMWKIICHKKHDTLLIFPLSDLSGWLASGTDGSVGDSINSTPLLAGQTANTKSWNRASPLHCSRMLHCSERQTEARRPFWKQVACVPLSWTVTGDRMWGDREFGFHFQVTHTSKGHIIPGIRLFLLPVVFPWWIDADLYFMGTFV